MAGLRDQVTAVLLVPVMVDANVALCPSVSELVAGDKVITTGVNVMLADAVLVGSATLAAVTLTV
jgi:hypothetical protein